MSKKPLRISNSETIRQINVLSNIFGYENPETFVHFVIADFYSRNRGEVLKFLEEISPLPEDEESRYGEEDANNKN